MKRFAKRIFRRVARSVANELQLEFGNIQACNEAVAQKVLMQQYRILASSGRDRLPRFDDVGFRVFSQFEEDGILLYIFSLIPPVTRKCVEICVGNGRECMTTNLIVNHGWWGYLFDGNQTNVDVGTRFFRNNRDTALHPPVFRKAWITAESVNDELRAAGVTGLVDLLSLDIDGMDFWIWDAVNVIQPRVVVCETHNVIPSDIAITVPYDPAFVYPSENYRGASLAAMCKLGAKKGYRLIGTHRFGFNAFFLRKDLGTEFFPEVEPGACLNDPFTEMRSRSWAEIMDLKWHQV